MCLHRPLLICPQLLTCCSDLVHKKGHWEKIVNYYLHCSFHIAQINNSLISSWSSDHVTFYCCNVAYHSVNLAILQSICHRCVCVRILEYQSNCWFPRWICYLWFCRCTTLLENYEQQFFPMMAGACTPTGSSTERHVHALGKLRWVNWSRANMLKQWICYFEMHPIYMHLNCFISF